MEWNCLERSFCKIQRGVGFLGWLGSKNRSRVLAGLLCANARTVGGYTGNTNVCVGW